MISSKAAAVSSRDAACWFEEIDRLFEATVSVSTLSFNAFAVILISAINSETELPKALISNWL